MIVTGKYGRSRTSCLAIIETENGFLVETYSIPQDIERTYVFESFDSLVVWMKDNLKTIKELRGEVT